MECNGLLGALISNVDTSQVFPLGTTTRAMTTANGFMGEFMYMKGVASTAVGDLVLLNYDDYGTTLLIDGLIGPVGVAMAATVASTYGWYQVQGKANAFVEASVAEDADLYALAASSAAKAGKTGAGLSEIIGARSAEATTTSASIVEVEINFPVLGKSTG